MVDIHCHILPGIDDGSKNWETSLAMCRMAAQDGIRHIVATPHANGQFAYDRERYQSLLDELQAKASDLTFSLGCDFHLSYENVEDAVKHPERYSIGAGRFLLAELSDYSTRSQVKDLLFRLQCGGFTTVITHPERSEVVARYPELPAEFVDEGSILQVTANALTGAWGKTVKKRAERMLKDGLVGVIATDAHEEKRRVPVLSAGRKAAAKILGEDGAALLVEGNPRAIAGL